MLIQIVYNEILIKERKMKKLLMRQTIIKKER